MLQQIRDLFLDAKAQMSMVTVILGVLIIISGSVSFAMFIVEEGFPVSHFCLFCLF